MDASRTWTVKTDHDRGRLSHREKVVAALAAFAVVPAGVVATTLGWPGWATFWFAVLCSVVAAAWLRRLIVKPALPDILIEADDFAHLDAVLAARGPQAADLRAALERGVLTTSERDALADL